MRRFAALCLLASLLIGCPAPSEPKPKPPGGDSTDATPTDTSGLTDWKAKLAPEDDAWKGTEQAFILNNGSEPETLDPHLMTGVTEGRIAAALFEGLVTQHPETLAPTPGVAESWDVSADGTVYTFHLRETTWSDGTPLTAQDFYDSWKRALTPETANQYGYMLYPIKNAEAHHKGELKDFGQVGLKVEDPQTLVVTLANPCPYFLDLVAFSTLLPVPIKVIQEHGDQWSRPENIVSNGAFVLKEWKQNQRIVVEKNPRYWDKEFVKLEKVTFLPHDDAETAYKLFLQDQCDWLTSIPLPKIDEVKRLPEYYVQPYLGSYFYRFNVTKPPFDDVRIRKAFSMAVDREVITRDLLKAGQLPATWFTPQMTGYEPPKGLKFDVQKARDLLAEAGFPDGDGLPMVELLYNTSESHKVVAEALVQQWKENLGITVAPRNTEWKVYLKEVDNLNFNLARAGWIGDYADPNTFLDMFVTGGGNNNTGWSNERYDELIALAGKETDRTKRFALLKEAETILVEQELPILPIYIYVNQGLLKEKVNGWFENVRDVHPLKYIWVEAE